MDTPPPRQQDRANGRANITQPSKESNVSINLNSAATRQEPGNESHNLTQPTTTMSSSKQHSNSNDHIKYYNQSHRNTQNSNSDSHMEDIISEPNRIIPRQQESFNHSSNASHDRTQSLYPNHISISGLETSHTGCGSSQLEHLPLHEVEQGTYPLESAARATTEMNALQTTPQSGGWEARIGQGISTEQPQEPIAMQTDQSAAGTRRITERKTQQKRKECPTEVEHNHNRARLTKRTQTMPEVQASSEEYAHNTIVNSQPRPLMKRARIQHQGQVQPRKTLLARERGSTARAHEVSDAGKMAASLWKVPATATPTYTSQGDRREEGEGDIQSLELKHRGRGGFDGIG